MHPAERGLCEWDRGGERGLRELHRAARERDRAGAADVNRSHDHDPHPDADPYIDADNADADPYAHADHTNANTHDRP